jgi:hypothetical protein
MSKITLATSLLRQAKIGLTAGEKAAQTKRSAATLYTIAAKAASTKKARRAAGF